MITICLNYLADYGDQFHVEILLPAFNIDIIELHYCRVTREISYQALVIPAKAGIQYFWLLRCFWITASAGMTAIFATKS